MKVAFDQPVETNNNGILRALRYHPKHLPKMWREGPKIDQKLFYGVGDPMPSTISDPQYLTKTKIQTTQKLQHAKGGTYFGYPFVNLELWTEFFPRQESFYEK